METSDFRWMGILYVDFILYSDPENKKEQNYNVCSI